MSASALVLDLMRAHYRGDTQAFRSFALRLARITKSPTTRQTMMDVIEKGGRHLHRADPNSWQSPQRRAPTQSDGMLSPAVPVSLDELMLVEDLRAEVDAIVLELAHRSELAERNLTPRSRLLFCGPPGNGKTSVASAIGHELDMPAYTVTIPALVSQFLGGTGGNLQKLFATVRDGTVVVFDEIDAIGSERARPDQAASKEQNGVVNVMLTLLDRHQGGTLVATTNRLDVLDPALVRRFDDVLHFPEPNDAQKAALAARLADGHGIDAPFVGDCPNFDAVAKRVVGAARRIVMREILAAKEAASEDLDDGTEEPLH